MSQSTYTDVIAQNFKVYVEGVQVPWQDIMVNAGLGTKPVATITVPAAPFLMDIARFYSPKVHIFYTDMVSAREDPDKVLFSGFINQVSYFKSRENGQFVIQFSCSHRYEVMGQLIFDYFDVQNLNQVGQEGTHLASLNSIQQIVTALSGLESGPNPAKQIAPSNPTGDPRVCPSFLSTQYTSGQLTGLPGFAVNLWQQIKAAVYNILKNSPGMSMNKTFTDLYIPLIEGSYTPIGSSSPSTGGLQFFQRMTGHTFLEKLLSTVQYTCGQNTTLNPKVPPAYNNLVGGSAQIEMATRNLQQIFQSMGGQSSFLELLQATYGGMDYDMAFLASPVWNTSSNTAQDIIVHPIMSAYYAPSCNVYYPTMYDSINVTYDEYATPTRISVISPDFLQSTASSMTTLQFRSPPEYRFAIAQAAVNSTKAPTLYSAGQTLSQNYGAYSVPELGRGVIPAIINMPQWLNYYTFTKDQVGSPVTTQLPPQMAADFEKSWAARYGTSYPGMNPFSASSGLQPYQMLLMASADSFYTNQVAKQRAGSVDGPFNPYPIPGYPMDVIDSSPVAPSFHGFCTSVTHSISAAGSARTTVNLTAMMTYSELANYYLPMISPWLQTQLGMATNPSIVNNSTGVTAANSFYNGTLGTGVFCAAPEVIYNFATGQPNPVVLSSSGLINGSYPGGAPSFTGAMQTVFREIESKSDVETAFGLKFIDMNVDNYNSTVLSYQDPHLNSSQQGLLSLGQNQFLDYGLPNT